MPWLRAEVPLHTCILRGGQDDCAVSLQSLHTLPVGESRNLHHHPLREAGRLSRFRPGMTQTGPASHEELLQLPVEYWSSLLFDMNTTRASDSMCLARSDARFTRPHLEKIGKRASDTCWWCDRGVKQSRKHLFKGCKK